MKILLHKPKRVLPKTKFGQIHIKILINMAFSPQHFLSNLNSKNGPAKANRFQVLIPIPPYLSSFVQNSVIEQSLIMANDISFFQVRNDPLSGGASLTTFLSLQCEVAELPGKTLLSQDVKIYGPTFKVPYQTQYNDLTLTFVCSNIFYERKLFDVWLNAIMPLDTNNLRYPKGETSRYLTNIKIMQYDDFIREIYAVDCIDAFPIGIASQPLNWGDENFHRLSVQFAYQKYNPITSGNSDLSTLGMQLFGNDFSEYLKYLTF